MMYRNLISEVNHMPEAIRDCFRLLWEQHVYWTRMTILSLAADSPDLQPTTDRLLQNAVDFGTLFRNFYGDEAAATISRLIREHLLIAAQLVQAAKAGDNAAAEDAERRWYANADQIVCFLNQINPYWQVESMRAMWREHLALTKAEAVARLNKNYGEDIEVFGRIEQLAMTMADEFANGIIRQFCC